MVAMSTCPEIMMSDYDKIRHLFIERLSIDPSLMNRRESELLEQHIDRIVMQPFPSVYEKMEKYLDKHYDEVLKGLKYPIIGNTVKNKINSVRDNAGELSKNLRNLLTFNDEQFKSMPNKRRMEILTRSWNNTMLANKIRSDWDEVMYYLKRHQNDEAGIKVIANELQKEHYRIDRKYYIFDVIVNKEQITISSFTIRNIDKDRSKNQIMQI